MRLVLGALAYLLGVGAVVAASFGAYHVMLPSERNAAVTTASNAATVTTASSVPAPRPEPKRVEPIRPVDEPLQSPTPKYELSSASATPSVPLTSTAAYNKKKAKEQSAQHTAQRKHRAPRSAHEPRMSREAANAYGWGQNYAPPPMRRSGDWTIY